MTPAGSISRRDVWQAGLARRLKELIPHLLTVRAR